MCGSIAGKLGKGDGEIGDDREDESLKNQKICGAFVVAEGEEEGDRDGATGEGVGATAMAVWVYRSRREREMGRQGRKKTRERKNIFIFKFYVFRWKINIKYILQKLRFYFLT